MSKNIEIELDALLTILETQIGKAQVVNDDLANEYFTITGPEDTLHKYLVRYYDNANLRNSIIGDYLIQMAKSAAELRTLADKLMHKASVST